MSINDPGGGGRALDMELGARVMGMSRNVMAARHVLGFGRICSEAEVTKQQPGAERRHIRDHTQTVSESTHRWREAYWERVDMSRKEVVSPS